MADIQSLRKRVEQINLNLKTAHSARRRESEALMELWQQIRARFARQEEELVMLRKRTAELEDTKEELTGMVRTLLGAVEESLQGIRNDTAPKIATMAGDLLAAEPGEALRADSEESFSAEADDEPGTVAEVPPIDRHPSDVGESLSPGIRALIGRVEGALDGRGADFDDSFSTGRDERAYAPDVAIPVSDDEPQIDGPDAEHRRDLREIEKLRDELQGLRRRIAISDG